MANKKMKLLLEEINNMDQSYPLKISSTDLIKDELYKIEKILYVDSPFGETKKAVITRILDKEDKARSYFLPDVIAQKVFAVYKNADDIQCYEIYLQLKGFINEEKRQCPVINIVYLGSAQLQKEVKQLLDDINYTSQYPEKISPKDLMIDFFYPIVGIKYVNSLYSSDNIAVVVNILVNDKMRSFFLPDIIADRFKIAYNTAKEIDYSNLCRFERLFKAKTNAMSNHKDS